MLPKFIRATLYVLALLTTLFCLRPDGPVSAAGPEISPEQAIIQALGEVGANDFRVSDMGPNGDTNYNAFLPAVAYNSTNNQYLVVWYGDDNSGGLVDNEYEIFGQVINAATGAEIGSDFRISSMGPDGTTNYGAFGPAVAYNSLNNQYLVVWYGGGFSQYEIYGQRLNAATRAPIGGHIRLSDMGPDGNPDYDAYSPAVAYNSTDNQYLVVWNGDDNSGGLVDEEYEIFGQRVEGATGAEIGVDFRISEMGGTGNATYDAYSPAVAYHSQQNEYLVVWSGDHNVGGLVDEEFEIFGQRLNATGAKISPNNVRLSSMGPNGNAAYDASEPDIAYSSATNRYLVAWSGDHNSGGLVNDEFEIFGQLVAALSGGGVTTFGQLRLSSMGGTGDASFDANTPAVGYNSAANGFLVVWSGNTIFSLTGELEIFGQRVSPTDGSEIDGDTRLSNMGPANVTTVGAFTPAVAANSANSEYLVVWQGDDIVFPFVNDEYEIFGQRFAVPSGRVYLPLVVK